MRTPPKNSFDNSLTTESLRLAALPALLFPAVMLRRGEAEGKGQTLLRRISVRVHVPAPVRVLAGRCARVFYAACENECHLRRRGGSHGRARQPHRACDVIGPRGERVAVARAHSCGALGHHIVALNRPLRRRPSSTRSGHGWNRLPAHTSAPVWWRWEPSASALKGKCRRAPVANIHRRRAPASASSEGPSSGFEHSLAPDPGCGRGTELVPLGRTLT